jgi:hypothetical protein
MVFFLREDLFAAHTLDLAGLRRHAYEHLHPDDDETLPDPGAGDGPLPTANEEADDGDAG